MKTTKTYSIDEEIYTSFDKLTEKLNANKSSIIEDRIVEYLKENKVPSHSTYALELNPNYEVTIENQDENFTYLSDDTKIPNPVFKQIYKKVEKISEELKPLVIKLHTDNYEVIKNIEDYKKEDDHVFILISNFEFDYIGQSRIDGRPIFKINGETFNRFFSNNFQKIRRYIMESEHIVFYCAGNIINLCVNDVEEIKPLKDFEIWEG